MRIFKILLALCLFFQLVAAATLQGRIVDAEGNPLIGANVYLEDTFLGTPSRSDGTFRIDKIPAGQYRLKVSLIGYYSKTLEVRLEQTAVRDLGDISIEVGGLRSETIVVTASKYEQKRQDVSTTMALVNSTELRQRNARTLEDAIRYVPGINMNGSQINIRGASGYSRGAGSRVLLLVDGMPYLTGDSRDAVLESLPMHQIDRVEVIKGAGSALYGSSALGGVVNVITKEITEKPELFLRFYGGIWDKPYYEQWRWSERSRYLAGAQVNFAKKLGPVGLMLGASHDYDDAYKQNDWFKLMKLSGKLQIDLSSVQRWVINTNYMEKRRGNFFYWQNLDHALVPPIEQLHEQVHTQRFYLSSLYRYLLGVDRYYNIRAIWYWNRFTDTIDPVEGVIGNRSTSNFLNLETQLHLSKGINHLGSGLEFNYQNVESNIFGTAAGITASAYLQDDLSLGEKWRLSAGLRFDYYAIDTLKAAAQLNPKLGLVFKPWPLGAFRLSAGRGFRAPSMAEAFTSTSASGIIVMPNPLLKPERSTSYEFGLNQIFSQNVALDLVIFYGDYWDLIEATFKEGTYVQFRNVTRARVTGFESTLQWQLGSWPLQGNIGYTYSFPWDLKLDDYLTYRPRHILYSSILWTQGVLGVSADYRYLKKYDRIDANFALIIPDSEERVDAHIVDLRFLVTAPFRMRGLQLSFQVNNLFQYNYVDLVAAVAPIRHYIITLEKIF